MFMKQIASRKRTPDSMARKGAFAAVGMAFAILGILLLDAKPVARLREAAAGKPIIIIYFDDVEPLATLCPNGRRIEVTLGGRANDWVPGRTSEADVIVTQASTGAFAVGHYRAVPAQAGSVQDPLTHVVEAHTLAGSPPFEEGPAEVCYFEEVWFRGQLVDSWSRCAEVVLVDEE